MFAWCHGAPGIGLARADALAALGGGDEYAPLREDLALALATTHASGFGQGHSLCHGDLGNAELLLAAGMPTEPVAAQVLATPPRCGTPAEVETPSLMIGLAGIGYGLLRLASPETVPSVLLAQGPVA
jgi:lantibiotic modifying enzyme